MSNQNDYSTGCGILIVCLGLGFLISVAPGIVGAIIGFLMACLIFAAPIIFIVAIVIAFSTPKK